MIILTSFEQHACSPDITVRDVLARIDASPYFFQVVIDAAGKLCGTVTDGDIRRAMLHGVGLDASVKAVMHTQPVVGRAGDGELNNEKLHRTGSSRAFLPILDGDGNLVEIYVDQTGDASGIRTALVMAGGPGTRLGQRTRDLPKPLLHVAGRPVLDHVLGGLESSGIERILVSVYYLADKIENFLKERPTNAKIDVVHETSRLGTAGALSRIGKGIAAGPLLVVNGDVLTKVDYAALHEFHLRHGYDATIGVARHEVQIPFGVVRYKEDGLFAGIEEKPRITNFVAAGVYYLSQQFISLVPPDRPMDMPELLNLGRGIGLRIGIFPIHEYWTDIGRPDDLERADDWHRSTTVSK